MSHTMIRAMLTMAIFSATTSIAMAGDAISNQFGTLPDGRCVDAVALPRKADTVVANSNTQGRYLATGQGYVSALRLTQQSRIQDNGRILVVFEPATPGGIPLYQSRDAGCSWHKMGEIRDQSHADDSRWQLRWQPHLSELPRASGDLPAGSLLLAASSIFLDDEGHAAQQELQLYASRDGGQKWEYRSSIIQGHGRPIDPLNQGVWEPNIVIVDDGRMLAFYASEQHKQDGFNQLLAYKISLDGGRSWGDEIVNAAFHGGVERPGMPVIERIAQRGYAMVYENVHGERNGGQIYLKLSHDGLNWGPPDARGVGIQTASGAWPRYTPSVHWIPGETDHGILLVSASRSGGGGDAEGHTLYRNNNGGQGPWWEMASPVRKYNGNIHTGWTQAMLLNEDGTLLHITSSSNMRSPKQISANEILFASKTLALNRYEAENAERARAAQMEDASASLGRKVRLASGTDASLVFELQAGTAGNRRLLVRYSHIGFPTVPQVEVNEQILPAPSTQSAEADSNWSMAEFMLPMKTGLNRIVLTNPSRPLDYDYIEVHPLEP